MPAPEIEPGNGPQEPPLSRFVITATAELPVADALELPQELGRLGLRDIHILEVMGEAEEIPADSLTAMVRHAATPIAAFLRPPEDDAAAIERVKRIVNPLKGHDITLVRDLLAIGSQRTDDVRNIGSTAIELLKAAFRSEGITWQAAPAGVSVISLLYPGFEAVPFRAAFTVTPPERIQNMTVGAVLELTDAEKQSLFQRWGGVPPRDLYDPVTAGIATADAQTFRDQYLAHVAGNPPGSVQC